jgi:uncharacterized damage-inducible protein DinB
MTKELFVMYAKYNQAGNKAIYDIASKLSNDEREKDRGSYYGSLSGLVRHIFGGTYFFLGLYKGALAGNAAALKALAALDGIAKLPEGKLTDGQWKDVGKALEIADAAYINLCETLTEADITSPLKIDWYGGNPASVPLCFMLHQLIVHNTHHRGQVSQILDELKIDNDYSGINVAFLPK